MGMSTYNPERIGGGGATSTPHAKSSNRGREGVVVQEHPLPAITQ